MAQNPNNKKPGIRKKEASGGAICFLLAGCVAELYLLLVRRYYVYGTLKQVVGWDTALHILIYVGLALLAAGILLAALWRKSAGVRRGCAWGLLGTGLFLSAGNWLVCNVYPRGTTVLSVVVPAVALLGILWNLYDRECAFSLTILGANLLVVWICRRGIANEAWRLRVMVGACVFLVLLAVAALLTRRVEKADGLWGNVRLIPARSDYLVVYLSCALAAAATVISLLSAAAAYYALWAVALVAFILAGYYTVKLL